MKETNKRIDSSMTWSKFQNFFENPSGLNSDDYHKLFKSEYHHKLIEWEGAVLRVDSAFENDEYTRDQDNQQ